MADHTITLTAAQERAVSRLGGPQALQTHIDTWLQPLIGELALSDRKEVAAAYLAASPSVQLAVKGLLGLG